jgi:hypothetical protein
MLAALLLLAQLQPLPPQLIALDSEQGRKLLVESTANRAFFALVGTFEQQRSGPLCGAAASVAVLNALPLRAPEIPQLSPSRAFTQDNVFEKPALDAVARGGATLEQLASYLRSAGADARAVHASDTTLTAFRAEAAKSLTTAGDYVLIDFLRSELGQDFGAHWSPLAAWHAGSDRFLVLDVNRIRYPPYWAKAEDVFRAMNTHDPDAGASRGYLVVTAQAGAPGRVPIPTVTHKIFRFVAGAALGVFVLAAPPKAELRLRFCICAVAGGLLVRWRMRRSLIPRAQ